MYGFYKNWRNGERITLRLFNKCWKVEIEWCKCQCLFGIGWSKFVKEADIRVDDTCIFECTGVRMEFNICIERHNDQYFITANPGFILTIFYLFINIIIFVLFAILFADLCGVKFFQIVSSQSLEQDRIVRLQNCV